MAALLASLTVALAATGDSAEISYAEMLERMVDLRWLAEAPEPGERGFQFSSYDRRSDAGREDQDAWYANGDRGVYLREETVDGRTEYVMADCAGPGAVVRIWSANPTGTLRFYLDGAMAFEIPFTDLCSGEKEPFLAPLSGVHSRGWNCFVPIPFQKHLKLTSSTNDFYYHVNVCTWPESTAVPTFSAALLEQHDSLLARNCKLLGNPGTLYPYPGPEAAARSYQKTIAPGKTVILDALEGPGLVRRLALRPSSSDLWNTLRDVRLVVRVDGENAVDCPLGDFFGTAPDFTPYAGYPLGVDNSGWGYCHFPMPLKHSMTIDLVHEGDAPLQLEGALVFEPGAVADSPLYFRAGWRQDVDIATHPRSDYPILDAEGSGRFVGCSLAIRNPVRNWWGEGDEHFFVDGEDFPSTFGTGTEDYFGYAWCCADLFEHPYHNQPRCDGPGNYGWTSVNRFHVLDQVPFHRSFLFDMELWHWANCRVDLATVAWWYGAAGASAAFPAVAAGQRRARPIEPVVIKRVPGAHEGEKLKVVAISGGKHQTQGMGGYSQDWSNESQLWWIDGAEGDTLDLELPVKAAGRYEVRAQFTRAIDYGIVQLAIDQEPLGEPIDLFHDGVVHTGELTLGVRRLPAGTRTLRLTITGANEKAVKRHMVGLDYILLNKLPDGER